MLGFPSLLHRHLASQPCGRLPWAVVMELALYQPEHGYYGPGPRRIGRQGDFFTSVSVGPLFGRLLALRAQHEWAAQGKPAGFTVIEQGAHDGQLACDVLDALGPDSALTYLIVEPNPRYQEVQRQRLAAQGASRVRWVASLAELQGESAPAAGLFLCNELPDAFPVHRVRWNGKDWEELYVEASPEVPVALARTCSPGPVQPSGNAGEKPALSPAPSFQFVSGPLSEPVLAAELATVPTDDLTPGHMLDINLAMLRWMDDLAHTAFRGAVFIADYGLDAEEFLVDTRAGGTLRRYHEHRMDDRVLEDLGECDLTTHINFTRLIQQARQKGLAVREYDLQGRVLGRMALPWLAAQEGRPPDAALMRQFQSLTHPAFLGRSFRCLILDKPAGAA